MEVSHSCIAANKECENERRGSKGRPFNAALYHSDHVIRSGYSRGSNPVLG